MPPRMNVFGDGSPRRDGIMSHRGNGTPLPPSSAPPPLATPLPKQHSRKDLPAICVDDIFIMDEQAEDVLKTPLGHLFEYKTMQAQKVPPSVEDDREIAWQAANPTVQLVEYLMRGYAALLPGTMAWKQQQRQILGDDKADLDEIPILPKDVPSPRQQLHILTQLKALTTRLFEEGRAYMTVRADRCTELHQAISEARNKSKQGSGVADFLLREGDKDYDRNFALQFPEDEIVSKLLEQQRQVLYDADPNKDNLDDLSNGTNVDLSKHKIDLRNADFILPSLHESTNLTEEEAEADPSDQARLRKKERMNKRLAEDNDAEVGGRARVLRDPWGLGEQDTQKVAQEAQETLKAAMENQGYGDEDFDDFEVYGDGEADAKIDENEDPVQRQHRVYFHQFALPGPTVEMYNIWLDAMAVCAPYAPPDSELALEMLNPMHVEDVFLAVYSRHILDGGDIVNQNEYTVTNLVSYNATIRAVAHLPFEHYNAERDTEEEEASKKELRDDALLVAFEAFDALCHSKHLHWNSSTFYNILKLASKFLTPETDLKGNVSVALLAEAQDDGMVSPRVLRQFLECHQPVNTELHEAYIDRNGLRPNAEDGSLPRLPTKWVVNVKKHRHDPRDETY